MAPIPQNNLKERLQILGYDPNLAAIKEQPIVDFKPPEILDLDQWSDFEDDV